MHLDLGWEGPLIRSRKMGLLLGGAPLVMSSKQGTKDTPYRLLKAAMLKTSLALNFG